MILAQFTWRISILSLPDLFLVANKKSLPGSLRTGTPGGVMSHLHAMSEITQGFNELKKVLDSERADTVGIWWLLGSQERPTLWGGSWLVVDGWRSVVGGWWFGWEDLEVERSGDLDGNSGGCLPVWSYFNHSRLREFHELFMVWCSTHTSSRTT